MKRTIIIILNIILSVSAFAQVKMGPKIQWEEEHWRWGKAIMEKGIIRHTYNFINVGDEPVILKEVSPGCGCTVADWSNKPVLPGKSGNIKITFDPKGKLGDNSKSITVKANTNPEAYSLTLSGEVITNKYQKYKYKLQYGNIAVVNNNIEVGRIKENATYSFDIPLANTGKKNIKIKHIINTPNIKIQEYEPTILADDEVVLKCIYTPVYPTFFGANTHEIKIYTDDDTLALKTFYLKTIVEEDFSKLTKKQIKQAPVFTIDKIEENFSVVNDNETKTTVFKITNKGKSDLILRKFVTPCECIGVVADKAILKKKETANITVSYSPRNYIGVDEKEINIITDDPKNSNVILTIKSYVLPSE